MTTEDQKRSKAQERRGARVYGGRQNSGSGNTDGHKNDVRTERESIEFKTTRQKSWSLKLEDLRTAEKNALLEGREALMGIDFLSQTPSGRLVTYRYVVMSEYDYLRLRREKQEADKDVSYLMGYLPDGEYLE